MQPPDTVEDAIPYRCNICGVANQLFPSTAHRELAKCDACGSTPRFRGIVHILSLSLFGRSIALGDFPTDKRLRGIGMSDWDGYATELAERLDFTNTFYHTEPRLDLTALAEDTPFRDLDFVICSEVFEHVSPPLPPPFRNLRRLLRPGGRLVFSVPYTSALVTTEHFPSLHHYKLQQFGEDWIIVNKTRNGNWEVFNNLIFHGGPGTVLEMRLFSEDDVLYHLRGAGFSDIEIFNKPVWDIGYYWPALPERYPNPDLFLGYLISARAS